MPKAWIAEKIRADMPLAHAAALILQVKLPEVMHYQAAAEAGKISGIHDMRVASKRLREALRVLRPALPKDARRRLLPVVEELNDALGQVRDRDVLRQALGRMVKQDATLEDLQIVRKQLARERRQAHRKLLATFAALAKSDFGRRYDKLMIDLADQGGSQPLLGEFAAEAVGQRLQDVMDNMHAVTGRGSIAQFHRQRIRVKKLKYALEPVVPLLPGQADHLYTLVSDLQELMGLVHDVDVQREVIEDWVKAHGLSDGLRRALKAIARQRRDLLAQTRAHVQVMSEADFESQLQELLRGLAEPAVAGQAAG